MLLKNSICKKIFFKLVLVELKECLRYKQKIIFQTNFDTSIYKKLFMSEELRATVTYQKQ